MKRFAIGLIALTISTAPAVTIASMLYSNPYDPVANMGNCTFDNSCRGPNWNDYAAQSFTLKADATLQSGTITTSGLTALGLSTPNGVNWAVYSDVGGLPTGAAIASGYSNIVSAINLGTDSSGQLNVAIDGFNTGSIDLGAGTYFFAVQANSSETNPQYLMQGVANSGAAETYNGTTWSTGYEGIGGVAMSLYGTTPVPIPATFWLVLSGMGGIIVIAKRRAVRSSSLLNWHHA